MTDINLIDTFVKSSVSNMATAGFKPLFCADLSLGWTTLCRREINNKNALYDKHFLTHKVVLGTTEFVFEFSLSKLLNFANDGVIIDLEKEGGEIKHYIFDCFKVLTDIKTDFDDILVLPFIQSNYQLLVFDLQNHFDKSNMARITAKSISEEHIIKSLRTPLQRSIYCFIQDTGRIIANAKTMENGKLFTSTYLYNMKNTLKLIEEE